MTYGKIFAALLVLATWDAQTALAATPEKDGESHETSHSGEDHTEATSGGQHEDKDDHKEEPDHKDGEEHKDDEGKEGENAESGSEVALNEAQVREAGIVVQPIRPMDVPIQISVPGEIRLNQYKSRIITPRIMAMVEKRHAVMGAVVQDGQKLVTLFSVEMAQAQGDFIVAASEWQRVRRLGEKIVSEKRLTEARVTYQQANARLLAYGLTEFQIKELLKNGDRKNPGQFDLLAGQGGLIVSDDFLEGEMIEPGKPIFKITDPNSRWVEAKINPADANAVSLDDEVSVKDGDLTFQGSVVQIDQTINEQTRTLGVKIELIGPQGNLRPGQFVDVLFSGNKRVSALAIPKGAVLRSPDGDWTIFQMISAGKYKPVEIRVLRETEDLAVIEGIPIGAHIVTQGAFFIQSELAKSGFDIHNH